MTEWTEVADPERVEMLATNDRQKAYYDYYELTGSRHNRGNVFFRMWGTARRSVERLRDQLEIKAQIRQLQTEWMGDLRGKRVLEIGCYDGNSVSLRMAMESASYLGVDLSERAISQFQEKLRARNLRDAQARAMDFLAVDFPFEPFDIIYANSVMHHFKHFEAFLQVLHARLRPQGRVITFDPLETPWSVWGVRRLYRPFQNDADWEWPFTRRSFRQIERYFHIRSMQGVLGYAKWAIPLVVLPGGKNVAVSFGRTLHAWDTRAAVRQGPGLWRCMQVAMCLMRREDCPQPANRAIHTGPPGTP